MDSTFFVTLALGFVLGFGVEWAIDYFVGRRKRLEADEPVSDSEVQRIKAENQRLAEQAASAESLRSVLSLRQQELDELRQELHAARTMNGADNNGWAQAQLVELKTLRDELAAKDAALSALDSQVQALSSQAFATRGDDGQKVENEQLRSALEAQDAELFALRQQLEEARSQMDSHSDRAHQLEPELVRMRTEAEQRSEAIVQMENRIRELESDLENRELATAEVMQLRFEKDEHQETLQKLRFQIEEKDREFQRLTDEAADMRRSLEGIEDARLLSAKAAALERDVESLKAISAAKDVAVAQAQEALSRMEAQLAFRPKPEDMSALQEQLSAREEEVASFKATVDELLRNLADEQHRVTRLQEDMVSREEILQELQRTREQFESAQMEHEQALASTREQFESLVADARSESERSVSAVREEFDAQLSASHAENQRLSEEIERAHAERKRLEAELAAAENEKLVLSQRLASEAVSVMAEPVIEPEVVELVATEPDHHTEVAVAESSDLIATELEGLKSQIAARDEAMKRLEEQVSRLAQIFRNPATDAAPPARPQMERPQLLVTRSDSNQRKDPLIQIRGVGHLFERKLWDAGIYTFADLAALNPDQVYEIVQPAEWQQIEPERWISEAAALALGTGT